MIFRISLATFNFRVQKLVEKLEQKLLALLELDMAGRLENLRE